MSINFFCQLIIYVLNVVVRCDVQIENKFKKGKKKKKERNGVIEDKALESDDQT